MLNDTITINPVTDTESMVCGKFLEKGEYSMKIRELSKLSCVNPETIRVYRNKGMLRPQRDVQNGYYDYSMEDLLNVLYIRKLTGSNLSLDTISYTYDHSDLSDILHGYRKELHRLNDEVEEILKRQYVLQITMEHLEEYRENMFGISLIDAFDTRYDSYFEENVSDPAMKVWMKHIELFTQTVGIKKELLTQETLPEKIPICLGIGSYKGVLSGYHMPIPDNVVIFPKGKYVTMHIALEDMDFVPGRKLQPMVDFIKENHYIIDSDTTAFLFRIDHSGPKPQRIYRLRVKVLECDTKIP